MDERIERACLLWDAGKLFVSHILSELQTVTIDLYHIVSAHANVGHVTRYFSIIDETGVSAIDTFYVISDN